MNEESGVLYDDYRPLPLLFLVVRRPAVTFKDLVDVIKLRRQLRVTGCRRIGDLEVEDVGRFVVRLEENRERSKVEVDNMIVFRCQPDGKPGLNRTGQPTCDIGR